VSRFADRASSLDDSLSPLGKLSSYNCYSLRTFLVETDTKVRIGENLPVRSGFLERRESHLQQLVERFPTQFHLCSKLGPDDELLSLV